MSKQFWHNFSVQIKNILKINFMASKKYTLLLAVLVMLQIAGNAQTKTDWGWDWKDSSKVPTKSIPQYNEFLNNQFPYPPKPRSAWELSLVAGSSIVLGDRKIFVKNAAGNNYNGGFALGASLRKSLGHVTSLRGSLTYANIQIPSAPGFTYVKVSNFVGSFDAVFSLNSLSHYRANPKTDIYVFAGLSVIASKYKNGTSGADGTFPESQTLGKIGKYAVLGAYDLGAGMSFKISPKFNIGFEQKFVVPTLGNDYLDGNKAGSFGDVLSYSTLRFNFNLGN
jgi:OmpA-OmpF porin, OOP family